MNQFIWIRIIQGQIKTPQNSGKKENLEWKIKYYPQCEVFDDYGSDVPSIIPILSSIVCYHQIRHIGYKTCHQNVERVHISKSVLNLLSSKYFDMISNRLLDLSLVLILFLVITWGLCKVINRDTLKIFLTSGSLPNACLTVGSLKKTDLRASQGKALQYIN